MHYMEPNGSSELLVQMRKGVVEYCVLAAIAREPSYGHEVATRLGGSGGVFGSLGSLYPLLARLRARGWIEGEWRDSPHGAPRRYYTLTADGQQVLNAFVVTWRGFANAVNSHIQTEEP